MQILIRHLLLAGLCAWLLSGTSQAQLVTTVAGQAEVIGNVDGDALTQALFNNPHGICIDGRGRVFIADRWNHKIRMLDTRTGQVSTWAGSGQIGADDGQGTAARFYEPWGITCSDEGVLYIADTKNHLIRKIDTFGNVTTLAGSGAYGVQDGPAFTAKFAEPSGIALADDGTLFICDHLGHTIRKLNLGGVVSTIAGQAFVDADSDGPGSVARFNRPFDIDMDLNGNILVADEWNHKIKRVTPNGFTTTVAGAGVLGSDDGHASQARFNYPWDVLMDSSGVIYVMDGFNYTVRRIEDDTVTTYCGTTRNTGAFDGYGDQAAFSGATAICYDERENVIYVGDAYNELIRKIEPSSGAALISSPSLLAVDTVCTGTFVSFTAVPNYFSIYDFYLDGTLVQSTTSDEYVFNFSTPGDVELKVIGTHSDGWTAESPVSRIHVATQPGSDFTYALEATQSDGYLMRFLPTDTSAHSYLWNFGDPASGAKNTSTLKFPTHLYAGTGPYDATLTVANGGACRDTNYQANFVGVLDLVGSPIQPGDTICLGESVAFDVTTPLYNSYRYYLNGTEVANSAQTTFTSLPNERGDYEVQVIGVDGNGQEFVSAIFPFYVAEPPLTDFTYAYLGAQATGYEIGFDDLSTGARAWQWNFGDPASGPQNTSTLASPSHIYELVGRYPVQLITIGEGGCRDTLFRQDYVAIAGLNAQEGTAAQPGLVLNIGDTLCVNEPILFSAQPTDFAQYAFYVAGLEVQQGPSPRYETQFPQGGRYEIEVVGIEADGRRAEAQPFEIVIADIPDARFQVVSETLTPTGYEVQFEALNPTYPSYWWDFGDPVSGVLNTSREARPTHYYTEFGLYTISLAVDAGGGCRDSLALVDFVNYEDVPSNLFIPNAFTPNGDGINDVLYLYGQQIVLLDWSIYNEWGERVFHTQTPGEGWDGRFRNESVTGDTYLYVARVTLADGKIETLKGQTTLIR